MPYAENGSVRIHYEFIDTSGGDAVVMLAGAGRPATDFDEVFCGPLRKAGFRPVRIDSRDTGLSDGFTRLSPDLLAVRGFALGEGGRPPPYDVADMAEDVRVALDAAGIERCHIVGRSLGAQVAQRFAMDRQERVLSLSLIMASSRSLATKVPDAVLQRLASEEIVDKATYIERQIRTTKANGMPEDQDIDRIRVEAETAWERGIHQGGTARHFAASLTLGDLREGVSQISQPVLVIHGRHDPLIPVALAEETAQAMPNARLILRDDMAHDGPPRLRRDWGEMVAAFLTDIAER